MKIKSYMKDYHDTFVSAKNDARAMYRAGFTAGGLALLAVGIFIGSIHAFAGIPLGIAGAALAVWAFVYFRPIKHK